MAHGDNIPGRVSLSHSNLYIYIYLFHSAWLPRKLRSGLQSQTLLVGRPKLYGQILHQNHVAVDSPNRYLAKNAYHAYTCTRSKPSVSCMKAACMIYENKSRCSASCGIDGPSEGSVRRFFLLLDLDDSCFLFEPATWDT